jgi:hypothetical protein
MPEGAVYVGRPTQWGNPFTIREDVAIRPNPEPMWAVMFGPRLLVRWDTRTLAAADAVDRYRRLLREHPSASAWIAALRGKDLACWCPLDQPCHADVLLKVANAGLLGDPEGPRREEKEQDS